VENQSFHFILQVTNQQFHSIMNRTRDHPRLLKLFLNCKFHHNNHFHSHFLHLKFCFIADFITSKIEGGQKLNGHYLSPDQQILYFLVTETSSQSRLQDFSKQVQ